MNENINKKKFQYKIVDSISEELKEEPAGIEGAWEEVSGLSDIDEKENEINPEDSLGNNPQKC